MPPPPFFRIPSELRNRIYHFALLNQRPQFYVANLSVDLCYLEEPGHIEPYENENLRWLLTSRQILSEGLDQFYTHAKLQWYSIWSCDRTNDLTLDGSTSIFDLGRVKAAELSLQMGKEHHERDGKSYDLVVPRGKEKWEGKDEDFAELGKVLKSLDQCAFQDLKLMVYLFRTFNKTRNYEDTGNRWVVDLGAGSDAGSEGNNENEEADDQDDDDDDYSDSDSDSYSEGYWNAYGTNLSDPDWINGYLVDFGFLENLGTQWKHIQTEYIPTYMLAYWGDGDPVAANIVAVPIIQQGLAEIAKVLIGGEGWTIQDSLEEVEHGAARWLLDANRAPDDERVLELKHTGLRSYVGDCEGCYDEEETFTLHDDRGDGIIRFMAGKCGHVVELETPVVGREM